MQGFTWFQSMSESLDAREFSLRMTFTLLHFLWQGLLVALFVAAAASFAQRAAARVRYAINFAALVIVAACLPATFSLVQAPELPPVETSQPAGDKTAVAEQPRQSAIAGDDAALATSFGEMDSETVVDRANPPGFAMAPAQMTANDREFGSHVSEPTRTETNLSPATAMVVTALYAAGVCLMLLRLLAAVGGGRRLRSVCRTVTDPELLSLVHRQAQSIGLQRVPVVAGCERVLVPMVVGVIRPLVLLPMSVTTGLDHDQLAAIISHEFAHIRRWDLLANLFQRIVESLLFFHPAVWFISRRVSAERELCCDDLVVRSGCGNIEYAGALIRVAELYAATIRPALQPQIAALRASGERPSELSRRVYRLLGVGNAPKVGSWRSIALACTLIVASAAAYAAVPQSDQDRAAKSGEADQESTKNTAADSVRDKPTSKQLAKSTTKKSAPKNPAVDKAIVSGTVLDPKGAPAAGVRVYSTWYQGGADVRTDTKGRFELQMLRKQLSYRPIRASAEAGRLQAQQLFSQKIMRAKHQSTLRWQVRLQLQPAKRVELLIIGGDAQPIQGATAGVLAGNSIVEHGTSNADGKAVLHIPHDVRANYVFAFADHKGMDYRAYVLPRGRDRDKNAKLPELPSEPVLLTLDGVKPLTVRLQEPDGSPIVGVELYPWLVRKPGQPQDLNLSFFTHLVKQKTDDSGATVFNWIPHWNARSLTIWPNSKAHVRQRGSYDPEKGGGTLTITLDRLVPISGRVTMPDGSPAVGTTVSAVGEGFQFDGFRRKVTTDREGRYEIKAAPNMVYLVTAKYEKLAAAPQTDFAVWPDKPIAGLDLQLQPATRIFGRVTTGSDRRPLADQRISMYQYGGDAHNNKEINLPNPEESRTWVQPMDFHNTTSDADGRFELFVGPGKFDIRGPRQSKIEKFDITDETEREFNFRAARPKTLMLSGGVVSGSAARAVPEAEISGIYRHDMAGRDLLASSDKLGQFKVEREPYRTVLHAKSTDGRLAGVVEIGPDDKTVTIPLEPLVTASGRLVDSEGSPLPDQEIRYGVDVHLGDDDAPFRTSFGGHTTTDERGEFKLRKLIPGQLFKINVTTERDSQGRGIGWRTVGKVTPEPAERIELGDLTLKPEYRPPTTEQRIARTFKVDGTPLERFENAKSNAKLGRQHVLILFGNPAGNLVNQLMTLRYKDPETRSAFHPFRVMAIDARPQKSSTVNALANKIDFPLTDGRNIFSVVVMNAAGQRIATASAADLTFGGVISKDKVMTFLNEQAIEPLDARKLLDEALARAKWENKRIIVQETATWCGPCWRLSQFLDKHRKTWEKDYLWVKMDHRWKGSRQMMSDLRGDADGGVPWFAILDAEGNTLVTSNNSDGGNIGFPIEKSGQVHFDRMLNETALRMTKAEIEQMVDALPDEP